MEEDSSERGGSVGDNGDPLVGRYVGRGLGTAILLGKVVSFDASKKIFAVSYENGDSEDLDAAELGRILIADERADGRSLLPRKRKLDRQIASEECKRRIIAEYPRMLELPSSSREFAGIPEEFIPFLFTLYRFLISFGVKLLLSPFSVGDFVRSLECRARNPLLDDVHLSLMRALIRHLQRNLLPDSECLRLCEWSLLDALTWPAILLRYLHIMGHMKWLGEKGFTFGRSSDEYYVLSVPSKLEVLRILYEVLVDSAEFRKELDILGRLEEENENKPSPACRVLEMDVDGLGAHQVGGNNNNKCRLCGMSSFLIRCDGCLFSYHSRCIGINRVLLPEERWFCLECSFDKLGKTSVKEGREMSEVKYFGTDANSMVFLGTCNHLLVVGTSLNLGAYCRCYNRDDARKVINDIYSTSENALVYADICRCISTYLEVPLVTMQSVNNEPVGHPLNDKKPVGDYMSTPTIVPKRSVINEAGAEKFLTSLLDGNLNNVESHLAIIAEQITHMEESLQGLISGPLSDVEYNKQWHKLASKASSCRVLKFLLLELEKSIRVITFSPEWTELVDDSFSSPTNGPSRRSTEQYVVTPEPKAGSSNDKLKALKWWRGRKFSKIIFQKAVLHSSLVKKAGRQAGGLKEISGVHNIEVWDLPRRSRQLAWRASVNSSMNASELALQVRCLDAHVRWRDLFRPEPNPPDDKGSEVDEAFQNAVICDKRIAVNKISYTLTFDSQKYLPLCVTANVLETETTDDGNEKLWFSEKHVPLYLIKEYEEKVGAKPCLGMLRSGSLPRLKRKELKSRGDIFSYLIHRRDTVRCHNCRVYCQKDRTVTSPPLKDSDLELFTCIKCYNQNLTSLIGSNKQTVNTKLPLPGLKQQQDLKAQDRKHSEQVGKVEVQSEMRHSASGFEYDCKASHGGHSVTSGLIWKQKHSDSGKNFRLNNVMLKRMGGLGPSRSITCCLCKKPYRSDLMYVRCETCTNWYHAHALELKETQYFDLVGFECCMCRRTHLPSFLMGSLAGQEVCRCIIENQFGTSLGDVRLRAIIRAEVGKVGHSMLMHPTLKCLHYMNELPMKLVLLTETSFNWNLEDTIFK